MRREKLHAQGGSGRRMARLSAAECPIQALPLALSRDFYLFRQPTTGTVLTVEERRFSAAPRALSLDLSSLAAARPWGICSCRQPTTGP